MWEVMRIDCHRVAKQQQRQERIQHKVRVNIVPRVYRVHNTVRLDLSPFPPPTGAKPMPGRP